MKSSHSALLTAVLALSMLAPGCAKQEPTAQATANAKDQEESLAPTAAASAVTAPADLKAKESAAAAPYAASDGVRARKAAEVSLT